MRDTDITPSDQSAFSELQLCLSHPEVFARLISLLHKNKASFKSPVEKVSLRMAAFRTESPFCRRGGQETILCGGT